MRTTKQLSITLPTEMAEAVREHVASGSYASESEVIRDGLRTLFARDAALETWLRGEVVTAAQALNTDPSRAMSTEEVRASLRENFNLRIVKE